MRCPKWSQWEYYRPASILRNEETSVVSRRRRTLTTRDRVLLTSVRKGSPSDPLTPRYSSQSAWHVQPSTTRALTADVGLSGCNVAVVILPWLNPIRKTFVGVNPTQTLHILNGDTHIETAHPLSMIPGVAGLRILLPSKAQRNNHNETIFAQEVDPAVSTLQTPEQPCR